MKTNNKQPVIIIEIERLGNEIVEGLGGNVLSTEGTGARGGALKLRIYSLDGVQTLCNCLISILELLFMQIQLKMLI